MHLSRYIPHTFAHYCDHGIGNDNGNGNPMGMGNKSCHDRDFNWNTKQSHWEQILINDLQNPSLHIQQLCTC